MFKHRIIVAAAMAGLTTMPIVAAFPSAGANPEVARCTTATLAGGYQMTGEGAFAGAALATVGRFVFDGAGKMSGHGIAILDMPSAVETYTLRDGTYNVREDCTGSLRFFVLHKTVPPFDHWHDADFVIAAGGKQFSMLYLTLELSEGKSLPIESILWSGHRQ